jgi:hypothetical protein
MSSPSATHHDFADGIRLLQGFLSQQSHEGVSIER